MPKTIYVDNTALTKDKDHTFLTEDVVAGGATIAVQSIVGFSNLDTASGQIICVGVVGEERTELRRTSNTSGQNPSASYKWVYLRDTLQFDHPQDTKVFVVDWNRADIQHASTVSGTKATIIASPSYPIQLKVDQLETLHKDTTKSSGFYFVRFNENIGDTNSDWSDPIPYAGYDDDMVASIKKRAIDELGEEVDGKIITHEFLNQCLWEARREYHKAPGKRPFRRKYNTDIGNVLTGSFRIELPTDVEKPYGPENVYGVRIGTNDNMSYIDKKDWDFHYVGKPHSYLLDAYTADTSSDLYLNDVRDFEDSGSVNIEGTDITYSAKSNSGGTLRISAHGDWDCSAGSDVWQNISLGLPDSFTVFSDPEHGSAFVYFNRPFGTTYIGQNIYADYYRTLPGYDSDYDRLDEPDYDMYVDYLKAKIKHRRNRGESDITKDPDYALWVFKKNNALVTEFTGAQIRIRPDVDHLMLPD